MWLADAWKDYEVLDTSGGEKLERWGKYVLVRPDPQVIWNTPKDDPLWRKYDARYARSSTGGGKWANLRLPEHWQVKYRELTFNVKPMNFKHTGVFPEQAANWDFIMETIRGAGRPINALNLFAYTGGATLACAAAGASVCHVDAAKGMVAWAKENAKSSGLEDRPIRWIVDDCAKFVEREIRRGRRYDAIIMDPPSYGRGPSGEIWKLEENLWPCNYGPAWGAGEPLLPVRRQGRELLHADSGYHPGGGFAGRGGPDAPLFCGTGHGSVLRDRGKAMVQLQPGGAAALVPAGVDSKGGGAQGCRSLRSVWLWKKTYVASLLSE